MIKINDKRDKSITTFGELEIGQFFIDECNNFVIKINGEEGHCFEEEALLYYDERDNVTIVEIEINIIK